MDLRRLCPYAFRRAVDGHPRTHLTDGDRGSDRPGDRRCAGPVRPALPGERALDRRAHERAVHGAVAGVLRAAAAGHRPVGDDGTHRTGGLHAGHPVPGPAGRARRRPGRRAGGRPRDGLRPHPAAADRRTPPRTARDHGRDPGRHRLDHRPGHRGGGDRPRRSRQPDLRRSEQLVQVRGADRLGAVRGTAVVADLLLVALQWLLTPWRHRRRSRRRPGRGQPEATTA